MRLSDLQNKNADGRLSCRKCGCGHLNPVDGDPLHKACRNCGHKIRLPLTKQEGNGEALGIRCPGCGRAGSAVIRTSQRPGRIHRRRECSHCGRRWTTREVGREV